MKNRSEMTMEELKSFVKYAIEEVNILNELYEYNKNDRKYNLSIFNDCQNEIQIDRRMAEIRRES